MTALDKLIEAVEAGVLKGTYDDLISFDRLCDAAIPQDTRGLNVHAFEAYEGSLDAALALHEALLPGCYTTLTSVGEATIFGNVSTHGTTWAELSDAEAITPARAWLLAILRAYRSVQA